MHQASQAKKLVSVLTTLMLVTGAKKAQKIRVLDQVSCIHYSVQFQKNKDRDVLVLLNSKNKINAMTLAYTGQLGFKVQKTNIGAQKIDKSLLTTYGMGIAAFLVLNKLGHFQFF